MKISKHSSNNFLFWKVSTRIKNFFSTIFVIIFILSTVLVVMLPISPDNMNRDSGVFLYTGWRLLHGEIPYRDIWDHKPPVIFFINAFGLTLTPESPWGVWLIEFGSLFLAALMGFTLFINSFGVIPALISTFLWLYSLTFLIQGGNLTTEYTLPMQFGAIWLIYQAEKLDSNKWLFFFIGILGGLAFFTKQNTVGIWIVILLYVAFGNKKRKNVTNFVRDIIPIIAGGSIVIFLFSLYFILHDSLFYFWDSAFYYNFFYSASENYINSIGTVSQSGYKYFSITGVSPFVVIGWVIGLGYVIFRKMTIFNQEMQLLIFIGVIDLPIELFMVSIPGRIYPHYFMTLLPAISILLATFFYILQIGSRQFIQSNSWFSRYGIYSLFILSIIIFELYSIKDYRKLTDWPNNLGNQNVVAYIQSETSTNDSVLFWGWETKYNFLAHRRAPSRFVYLIPLFQTGYVNEGIIEEFLNDIVVIRPRLIVDTIDKGIYSNIFEIESDRINLLFNSIKSMYFPVKKIANWKIYIDSYYVEKKKSR